MCMEYQNHVCLEVCVDSVESAIAAVKGGADRLELCGSLAAGGGVTPSLGLLRTVARTVPNVPFMVMIRPRTGDFVYSDAELEVMIEDIRMSREAGAAGVVFGVLTRGGDIDVNRSTTLANEAYGMESDMLSQGIRYDTRFTERYHISLNLLANTICRHAAFQDMRRVPHLSRVLTSGHETTCTTPEALANLRSLFRIMNRDNSDTRRAFDILPGSGISPFTVRSVLQELLPFGLRQVHMSGGRWIPSETLHRKEGMGMGVGEGEWAVWRTSEERVREVVQITSETCEKWAQQTKES